MESLHLNVPLSVIQILGALFCYLFIFRRNFPPALSPSLCLAVFFPSLVIPPALGHEAARGEEGPGPVASFGAALINAGLRVGSAAVN